MSVVSQGRYRQHLLLLSLLFSVPVCAAPGQPPAGGISYAYFFPAEVKGESGTEVTQQDFNLALPLAFIGQPEEGAGLLQLKYSERQFSLGDDYHQQVYDIALPLGYIRKLTDDSRFMAGFTPALKSSLEYIGADDFAFSAMAHYSYTGAVHGYNLGLMYGRELGESQLMPFINYNYSASDTLKFMVGFPFTRVEYNPQNGRSYFAGFSPNGGGWHVYRDGKEKDDFYYTQTGYRFSAGMRFDLYGPLQMSLEGGQQFGQELEFDNDEGSSSTVEIRDSAFISLSLNLKMP